jgi:hypothetical protein
VVSAAGGGGVVAPAGPTLGARRGAVDDAPPKQRYHGGQIVAQRGEKYIVEKVRRDPRSGDACSSLTPARRGTAQQLTPEWDGGSRGKVRPKGKRGKAA